MIVTRKTFLKNTVYVTLSQILSLLISAFLSIVLPKFVGVADYGYWQLFVLYTSFVGFLHFGFCDGVYLKYGGVTFEQLDIKFLGVEIKTFVLCQAIISVLIILLSVIIEMSYEKRFIFVSTGVYSFIANLTTVFSYVLLATNKIKTYSLSIMISKAILMLWFVILCITSISFKSVIVAFTVCSIIGLIILMKEFRLFFIKSVLPNKRSFKAMWPFVVSGFILMFSSIVSNLIIGSGRMVVESFWNISVFAKISFTISLSMFFLAFISQVSLVLFPVLRNITDESAASIFKRGGWLISYVMMACYLVIFPIDFFVERFLPNYLNSVQYMIYLLPVCLYLIKTQVLYVTFFKSLNKQKYLLYINIVTLLVAVSIYVISVINKSLTGILIGMMVACLVRSWAMQIYLNRYYKQKFDRINVIELAYSICFIILYQSVNLQSLFIYCLLFVFVITFYYMKILHEFISKIRR